MAFGKSSETTDESSHHEQHDETSFLILFFLGKRIPGTYPRTAVEPVGP